MRRCNDLCFKISIYSSDLWSEWIKLTKLVHCLCYCYSTTKEVEMVDILTGDNEGQWRSNCFYTWFINVHCSVSPMDLKPIRKKRISCQNHSALWAAEKNAFWHMYCAYLWLNTLFPKSLWLHFPMERNEPLSMILKSFFLYITRFYPHPSFFLCLWNNCHILVGPFSVDELVLRIDNLRDGSNQRCPFIGSYCHKRK